MALFESMLISACVAAAGNNTNQTACEKATEAGSKQSGIEQNVDIAEKKELNNLQRTAEDNLGKDIVAVVAGSVFIAKTLQSKAITFGLPTFGICSSIKTEIKPDQSMLKFEWKF